MKILFAFYNINNPGGIINHSETLAKGFLAAGHSVAFVELCWRENTTKKRSIDPTMYHETSVTGLPLSQGSGWLWEKENRFPYKGVENMHAWKEYAGSFDIILWQIPVPTKQKDNIGNMDWVELYNTSAKNFAVIHDGNFRKATAHINHIKDKISGLICVHPCAYHSVNLSIPKTMIFNPQDFDIEDVYKHMETWDNRKTGFLSCQTFKAWKHVDELVAAIPFLEKCEVKIVAGGGIEWNYMTSPDKCKPQYFYSDGRRIWDVALDYGMNSSLYIPSHEVSTILQQVRTLVDPSWSINYSRIGDHFNRVSVEAMINGAIPVARNLGMSTNLEGNGEVFKAGENYHMIPHNASSSEFGASLDYINNISKSEAMKFHENNASKLPMFNIHNVARQYIDFFNGLETGFYSKTEIAEDSEYTLRNSNNAIENFFGGE